MDIRAFISAWLYPIGFRHFKGSFDINHELDVNPTECNGSKLVKTSYTALMISVYSTTVSSLSWHRSRGFVTRPGHVQEIGHRRRRGRFLHAAQDLSAPVGHLGGGAVGDSALWRGGHHLDGHIRVARLGAFWRIRCGRAHWRQTW